MHQSHQHNISGPGPVHLPVLVSEVLSCLTPSAGESYLDLTAGYGGHAKEVLAKTKAPGKTTLVDRDGQAIAVLKSKFAGCEIIHRDFLGACQRLAEQGRSYDMVLCDLGASSPHFDNPERGFSFSLSGPLDMRMDQTQDLSAEKLVNEYPKAELTKLIRVYGEEKRAETIARRIVENRPVADTGQLADIIAGAFGRFGRRGKIHPATKTFQALRIAVNEELFQLSECLPLMVKLLAPGGRLAVISFHSLEDRIVKRYLAEHAGDRYDTEVRLLTKRPISASNNELVSNPRARSAKLRAAVKIKIHPPNFKEVSVGK